MIGNVMGGGKYQIGEFYLSSSSTSPASLFGGTWEQVKDKFLLAAGDIFTAGSTGGEANHTLTVDEMPSHKHDWKGYNTGSLLNYGTQYRFPIVGTDIWSTPMQPTGGGQPHNNMPPYLTIYIWRRIA